MTKVSLLIILFLFFNFSMAQELIIQENEEGFCYLDGVIESGFGTVYANVDPGVGASISWSVSAEEAGIYFVKWRYTVSGSTERPARLQVNSEVVLDTVYFPITGSGGEGWANWTETDSIPLHLNKGSNQISLEAYSTSGLGNYDYVSFLGDGLSRGNCIPMFRLSVSANVENAGTISIDPLQEYYDVGSTINLTAQANPGYFFQSWSGDVTGADSILTFSINENTEIEAIFLPDYTEMDSDVIGYATIQDDEGTPYFVIGGALGDTVEATSFETLKNYLSSPLPFVIKLSQKFIGNENINVNSNKTLLGINDQAHLQGIGLQIGQARNVIIKNVKISHVTPQDAIEINASKNVWIDHCELFSDRDHGTDYYDGLLDIKNASSFITISWSTFHDHYKTSLISSNDQAIADTAIRVTYHHNYFYNCNSRLPSIRFGTAHIFNNYYKDCNTAINSRMGACVRVEQNYFNNVSTAVMTAYSEEPGKVELIDNYFGMSNFITSPTCNLNIPYEYEHVLDETSDIPFLIAGEATSIEGPNYTPKLYSLENYPNPFNPSTMISYQLPMNSHVTLQIFDINGKIIETLVDQHQSSGAYVVEFVAEGLSSALYFYQLRANNFVQTKKMILIQ